MPNLSARNALPLAEMYRVLWRSGRLCVADLTVAPELPPEVLRSDAAWAFVLTTTTLATCRRGIAAIA